MTSEAYAVLAVLVEEVVLDAADGQTQELVDLAHPLGVAASQVVVDRDDVDAAAGQRVQVHGHRRDEGLALAGLHLGDLAGVQDHAADELHVEGPHPERADRGLARDGERLLQDLVEDGRPRFLRVVGVRTLERLRDPRPELGGLAPQRLVGQGLDGRFERVDALHARQHLLDVALVLRAEDLGQQTVDHD